MRRISVWALSALALLARAAAADVAPGDVIRAANREQVRELVPAEF